MARYEAVETPWILRPSAHMMVFRTYDKRTGAYLGVACETSAFRARLRAEKLYSVDMEHIEAFIRP